MSSLLFLQSRDFSLVEYQNQNVMTIRASGFVLIMFYSTRCSHCQVTVPAFKSVNHAVNGCQFAVVCIDTSPEIIQLSQHSSTPLQYTPYIVLYYNGMPFMEYKGRVDPRNVSIFVNKAVQYVMNPEDHEPHEPKSTRTIPDSTMFGMPLCGKQRTYLEFKDL